MRIVFGILLFFQCALFGQQQPPDPMRQALFPPEAVMRYQRAIGLSDKQAEDLRNETRRAQLQSTDLQWALQREMDRLLSLLRQPAVDEEQATAQLGKVLDAERAIKTAQIVLLIRIKNSLSPEQQARLRQILSEQAGR